MMSHTFSRRAFFKYSAAAAVAVAGMSLLGGCGSTNDPNNPYRTELDTQITNLDVTTVVLSKGSDVEKGKFNVLIRNSRGNPLIVSQNNFAVSVYGPEDKINEESGKMEEETVGRYYSMNSGGVQITGLTDNTIENGQAVQIQIQALGFPSEIKRDEIVVFKYVPIPTSVYAGYSMSWRITKEADDYTDITQPEEKTDSNS